MALQIDYKTRYGVNAQYWVLASVTTDKISKQGCLKFYGYSDQQSRIENYLPLEVYDIDIQYDKFDKYFNYQIIESNNTNQYKQGYLYAKENTERFKNATDLLIDSSIDYSTEEDS